MGNYCLSICHYQKSSCRFVFFNITGEDISICVSLAILISLFSEEGMFLRSSHILIMVLLQDELMSLQSNNITIDLDALVFGKLKHLKDFSVKTIISQIYLLRVKSLDLVNSIDIKLSLVKLPQECLMTGSPLGRQKSLNGKCESD